MYTIIQKLNKADTKTNGGDNCFYLNHSALGSKSFGSADMMWTGSESEARTILAAVKKHHKGNRRKFAIKEV